jgi:hypothetical protein
MLCGDKPRYRGSPGLARMLELGALQKSPVKTVGYGAQTCSAGYERKMVRILNFSFIRSSLVVSDNANRVPIGQLGGPSYPPRVPDLRSRRVLCKLCTGVETRGETKSNAENHSPSPSHVHELPGENTTAPCEPLFHPLQCHRNQATLPVPCERRSLSTRATLPDNCRYLTPPDHEEEAE